MSSQSLWPQSFFLGYNYICIFLKLLDVNFFIKATSKTPGTHATTLIIFNPLSGAKLPNNRPLFCEVFGVNACGRRVYEQRLRQCAQRAVCLTAPDRSRQL